MVKLQNIITVINQGTPQTDGAKRTLEIQNSFQEVTEDGGEPCKTCV